MIRWDAPGSYRVAFSTRNGGVSEGPYASLNLGRKTGDEAGRVDENRRRLCTEVGADAKRAALNLQLHSAIVNEARAGVRGVPGDGLWTDEPDVPILALAADCLPIAVVRPNGRPRAAVLHAGRIGLLAGIVEAGVRALGGDRPAAAIGPAIGPCCYEVGEDVARPYRARFGRAILRGRKLDLWTAAERLLREAGVATVERTDLCTACEEGRFFSYRRDGKPCGAHGVVAVVA
ncbi:MAG: polyphenol oxidase family protein [Actinomycetota bacterium]|nr:polyphenol oxidase family protein [Actinomycetota bacterium]